MSGGDRDPKANRLELANTLADGKPGLEGLRTLAAGVAHDFNNLLAVILSSTEFAAISLAPESAEAEALGDARTAALRAAELCKLILAFSGKRSALSSLVDMPSAVKAAIASIAVPENVDVELLSSVSSPTIVGDPTLIDQLLRGLIENAVTACTENGGRVAIAVHPDEAGFLRVDVQDNGVGMDEATLGRAFEPFFTTQFPSRGLGLSAALGITRSHDGTIELTSALGEGTQVRVALPAHAHRSIRKRPITRPIEGDAKRRVLAVDDEALVGRAISRVLEAGGYIVRVVNSGSEALARVESSPDDYDLVILDMTMPGLDGPETFRRLRELRPGIRVLLSSGYHHLDSTESLVATGHCWFLAKPYEPDQLLSIVSDILA